MVGSIATGLAITIYWAIRTKGRLGPDDDFGGPAPKGGPIIADELPPPGYAAQTGEGLSRGEPWA